MPGPLPKRMIGPALLEDAWNKHLDHSRAIRPSTSNGVLTSVTTHGTFHEVARQVNRGGGRGGAISVAFRGEYYSGATYLVGDEVWIESGANRGSYICIKDNPGAGHSPWVGGNYWAKRPSDSALGSWM